MVANMSDDDIWRLNRGGHDARKVYNAYVAAMHAQGPADGDPRQDRQGLRHGPRRRRPEHHAPAEEARRRGAAEPSATASTFRCRDEDIAELAVLPPGRRQRGAQVPARAAHARSVATCRQRRTSAPPLDGPPGSTLRRRCSRRRGEREISTTMAFVRMLVDPAQGQEHRPAHRARSCPDEARTFGMEGMFRQIGIYSSMGQLYTPQDADQLLYYQEDKKGQILEEGINEAGAMCSWIAAGTAYCEPRRQHGAVLHLLLDVRLPAGRRLLLGRGRHAGARLPDRRHRGPHDAGGRGPAAPGRPQPARGRPRSRTASPTIRRYAYELAVIVQDGLRRMYAGAGERLLLHHLHERELRAAGDAAGRRGRASSRACTCCASAGRGKVRVNLLGSGTILREVLAAAELLEKEFGVPADVFSVTSFTELRREALDVERWNLLHPASGAARALCAASVWPATTARSSRRPTTCARCRTRSANGCPGATTCSAPTVTVAATRAPRCVVSSKSIDATSCSRRSRRWPTTGSLDVATVRGAIARFGIDPEKPNPVTV